MEETVFFWSKKQCSRGVLSALLRGSPFARCPRVCTLLSAANGSRILGGVSTGKSHILDFFSFLGTFQGHIQSSSDSTLGAHMLRSCGCTSHPPTATAMPFISSALVLLNELLVNRTSWSWRGWGVGWGLASAPLEASVAGVAGDGAAVSPSAVTAMEEQVQVVLPVPPWKPKEWNTFLGQGTSLNEAS